MTVFHVLTRTTVATLERAVLAIAPPLDAVCILSWRFSGGPAPGCLAATNINGDGAIDISDPVWLHSPALAVEADAVGRHVRRAAVEERLDHVGELAPVGKDG